MAARENEQGKDKECARGLTSWEVSLRNAYLPHFRSRVNVSLNTR